MAKAELYLCPGPAHPPPVSDTSPTETWLTCQTLPQVIWNLRIDNLESFIIFLIYVLLKNHIYLFTNLFSGCMYGCLCGGQKTSLLVLFPPCQSWDINSGHQSALTTSTFTNWAFLPAIHLYTSEMVFPFLSEAILRMGIGTVVRASTKGAPLQRYQGCWWRVSFWVGSMLNTSFLICILLGSHIRRSVIKTLNIK